MGLMNWTGSDFRLVIAVMMLMIITRSSAAPVYVYSFCSNSSTYAVNSTFSNNLNIVLRSLSSNAATSSTGFDTTSAGVGTNDAIYGLFMCRGDQNTTECSDCVATAVREQPQRINCPRSKVGVLWYDLCMVKYDNQTLIGRLVQNPSILLSNTQDISGNQTSFTELLGNTLRELAGQAANGPQKGRKYANRVVNFTSLQPLYSMVQCTPDLSAGDCNQCLISEMSQLNVKLGGRVLQPSCNIRYEVAPFLNGPFNSSSPVLISKGKKKVSTGVIIAIVVPVVAVVVALVALGVCLFNKKAKKYVAFVEDREDFSTTESLQYDLGTLQSATNNFSDENKLGEGGFGGVYKGTLINGQEIAVKKLSISSSQGVKEFKNEVLLVAKLQHRNLVRLLGFCFAAQEKLLVYEYVPNKSLDYFLFDLEKQGQLDWGIRYKIIEGIARGMLYLHQDSRLRIIHRDLKPSNILLDANMTPKISDFGMARIFSVNQTQSNTSRVVGTYGYMSPEYAMHGQFSVKSDVYSFGILVLEIISGNRNSSFSESGHYEDLISYAWKTWRDSRPLEFVDPTIRDSCSAHEVMRCLHLGLLCVQDSVENRPTMATIVLTLDSYSVTLPVPEQPSLFTKSMVEPNFASLISSDQSSSKSKPWSVNDVSISELDPR